MSDPHPDSYNPCTLRRLSLLASIFAALSLSACASKQVQLRMALQVVSQPEKAQVRYRGKVVGEAPTDIDVRTYEDLEAIVATLNGMNVVEKRLRILSSDRAQLIFKFGKQSEQSPLARDLGVQNVLIFDYSEKVAFDVDKFDLKPEFLPLLNTQSDILRV